MAVGRFGGCVGATVRAYEAFVAAGVGAENPLGEVRDRLYLGDGAYAEALARLGGEDWRPREVSNAQKRPLAGSGGGRSPAAYRPGAHTMREIVGHFGVHHMTVSRAVHRLER